MKQCAILLLVSLIFLSSCDRGEPVIADPMELALITLSENLVCQPVTYSNSMVALINRNASTYLCNYDGNGNKFWQINVDGYALNSLSVQNSEYLNLYKDPQDNLLLTMYRPEVNQSDVITAQNIRMVKFNSEGQYLWQFTDSIHQSDTIVIQQDTIAMASKGIFKANDFVCLSEGNYAVVSSLKVNAIDSTYIQVSTYNSNDNSVSDTYFKIPGLRNMIDIYSTSDDRLFIISTIEGSVNSYFSLTDLSGNIAFDNLTQQNIEDSYFFQETASGQYLVSISFINSAVELRGALIGLSNSGDVDWTNMHDAVPGWIMMSVYQVADGYLFSGFNSDILPDVFDWRATFLTEEHRAVILKTDFSGNEIWNRIIDGSFYSAGAVSFGNSPISFFGGRYEASGENSFLIKFTSGGDIYN